MSHETDEERDCRECTGNATRVKPNSAGIVPYFAHYLYPPVHSLGNNCTMRRKIEIRQLDKQDCAAACLASIASHYGLDIPLTIIRQKCGTTTEGTSLKGILEAASHLSMNARAYKTSSPCYAIQHLTGIPVPSILHFRTGDGWLHFVVLYRISSGNILIMDPQDGKMHKLDEDKFKKLWTGYIVLVTPSSSFLKGNFTTPFSARMISLLKNHRKEIIPSVLGSLTYVLIGLGTSLLLQYTIDHIIPLNSFEPIFNCAILFGILIILSIFIGYIRTICLIRGSISIDATIIMEYIHHIFHLPLSFFREHSIGEIHSRINDVYRVRSFVSGKLTVMFISAIALSGSLLLLFSFYWKLAVMILGFIPIYLILYYWADRKNKTNHRRIIESSAKFDSTAIGAISSIDTAKNFSCEELFTRQVEIQYTNMAQALYCGGRGNALISTLIEATSQIMTFMVITLGAIFVVKGELTTGELISFYTLTSFFTSPLGALIESTRELNEAKIAAQRVFEVLDLGKEIDKSRMIPMPEQFGGDIIFESVSFRYPGKHPLFQRLSFTIHHGKINTITGANGCGKSTIASLIMRNLIPEEGQILINNINIHHFEIGQWRQHISIIPQHGNLFNGSVLENIAMGDKHPDIDKVLRLCGVVGMIDFINHSEEGLLKQVGEGGKNLSGGERIKILLVRALYRDPKIIIMDESTSQLDRKSIQMTISLTRSLSDQGITIVNISHDQNIMECSDYIVNLDTLYTKVNGCTPSHCS